MNCPFETNTAELLLEYSAGRLNGQPRLSLERHIESCPRCALFQEEQNAVWTALNSWEAPPVSMDFNRNLWRRIDAVAALPWYRELRLNIWKPAVPLAAAVALMTAGFLWDHPMARKTAHFSATEAIQVEQVLDDIQLLHQLDAASDNGARTM